MKFTLSWLKEYLNTNSSLEEICHKLNNIGLEVESLEDQSKSLAIFTVAKIIETKPHPDSSKLQICQVDVGKGENLQIICGAKNARTGIKVAYAPIGAIIPANQMIIKKAKIAGVESSGMLCSYAELGLNFEDFGSNAEGIIEIDEKHNVGDKISEVFGLGEAIIEINVTPNRGDCLGVFGIARDLSAAGLGTLKKPEIKTLNGNFLSPIQAKIESKNCDYFSGFYIKNIKNQTSPKWLKDKLESVGSNSISAIVDITNYVMLCLNQPLHSYDADQLSGDITIKDATENQNFKSLKDINYQLKGGELIIDNNQQIVGLAGIIGGSESSVSSETKNIFLEAAFFKAESITETARSHNILSDARYRFERGVDLENIQNALKMAANLILEICGGEISEIIEAGNNQKTKTVIEFDLNQIEQILGIKITKNSVVEILNNLGFAIQELDKNLLKIEVPSHRNDITISQDLIEEVIRIYGLNQITPQPLECSKSSSNQPLAAELIRNKLANSGLTETINYSFIDSKISAYFTEINPDLQLQNPIANQMNLMRHNLLIGLLQNIAKNQARGFEDLSLFEIGRIFSGTKEDQQKNSAAVVRVGKNKQPNHYRDQRNFDVFDVKKDLFNCLENLGFSEKSFQIISETPSYYHPYRSSALKLGKKVIGYFGELHPAILKKFDIKNRANVFELFIEELPINLNKKSNIKPFIISDLQAVNRDFAFVLDQEVKAEELLKKVPEVDKNLITEVNLFDIYQDEKLGKNKKSIAFSIKIQPTEKTLTNEEIEQISEKIILTISQEFNGVLRS